MAGEITRRSRHSTRKTRQIIGLSLVAIIPLLLGFSNRVYFPRNVGRTLLARAISLFLIDQFCSIWCTAFPSARPGTVLQDRHTDSGLKIFKRSTGLTYIDFRNRLRIESAKRLLAVPNASISEIAYKVGFQSLTQFNRLFRRIVGKSPTEFRHSFRTAKASKEDS